MTHDEIKKRLKVALEKDHGRQFSDEEVDAAATTLQTFARIGLEIAIEADRRQQKLKEFPTGFPMDRPGYTCPICGGGAYGEGAWFDQYGLKCGICQGAINRKEIPPDLGQDKDNWYSDWELEHYFNLKPPILRQWVKKRLLNMRTITRGGKGVHRRIFLIRENQQMLPPKDLLQSHTVIEIIDGKEWYCSRPWYHFVDPHQHLKGYKIMDYLKVVPLHTSSPDPNATDPNV